MLISTLFLLSQTQAPPVYDLDVDVRAAESRIYVMGTVSFTPTSDKAELILDKQMAGFTCKVDSPDFQTPPLAGPVVKGSDHRYTISIPRTGKSVRLRFSYRSGGQPGSLFSVTPAISFGSAWGANWYPLVAGGRFHGVGKLRIKPPSGQVVVASGEEMKSPSPGVVAYHVSKPTYFSFALSNYIKYTRKGKVPIEILSLTPRPYIEKYFDGLGRVMDTLAGEFGPFPFRKFTIAEVPGDVARAAGFNGASPQGFLLVESNALRSEDFNLPLPYLAHEAAHQWFPHSVGFAGSRGYFLPEALAQYGSLRCVEAIRGPEVGSTYRKEGMDTFDKTYSSEGYFRLAAAGQDSLLGTPPMTDAARQIAYSKGSLVWSMLSDELGAERFRKAMNHATRKHLFGEVPLDEFTKTVSDGAGADLKWFFDQWLERTGAPTLELGWKPAADGASVAISQQAPLYKATLEVQLRGANGETAVKSVRLDRLKTEATFRVPFKVTDIKLDPNNRFLFRLASKPAGQQ